MRFLKTPDWSRLVAWGDLRRLYLGLRSDPKVNGAGRYCFTPESRKQGSGELHS